VQSSPVKPPVFASKRQTHWEVSLVTQMATAHQANVRIGRVPVKTGIAQKVQLELRVGVVLVEFIVLDTLEMKV
jgi:hypothetical protein